MEQKDKKVALTKGEEEVMQLLWELGKGTVNDILERYGDEKPKYTTVATFLKLLEDKGYAGHLQQGKSNMYYPLVEKAEYAGSVASSVLDNFFGGSSHRVTIKGINVQQKAPIPKPHESLVHLGRGACFQK